MIAGTPQEARAWDRELRRRRKGIDKGAPPTHNAAMPRSRTAPFETHDSPPETVHIIGVPMDHGAGRRGVGMGPSALRIGGLHDKLKAAGREFVDHGDILIRTPERLRAKVEGKANNLPIVLRACDALHEHVQRIVLMGGFPLVIGGDHSINIGTMAGLAVGVRERYKAEKGKSKGRVPREIGVIWIDAHGDLNTPETSPSGNIHGMPVSVALGKGPRVLTHLGGFAPKVQANNVVLIGLRDLDREEKQAILDSGVHAFTMQDIDMRGMAGVVQEAISLATRNTDYLHVSFDIDSVDPRVAPGTGTTVFGGLTYREAHLALELISESGKLTSFEMVEVNPILDNYNMTGELAAGLIASALGKRIL
ncbi:MAG: arginase [Planctomycetota bacterium]|nr:MAG: arginase [Planctomycetota bacterium]